MTCWSCIHYRIEGCADWRTTEWGMNLGQLCPGFIYEPGTDEGVIRAALVAIESACLTPVPR